MDHPLADSHYDLLILGAGPIGLACGIEAKKAGLNYLILEKAPSATPFTTIRST
jgi:thioredoxin reductase